MSDSPRSMMDMQVVTKRVMPIKNQMIEMIMEIQHILHIVKDMLTKNQQEEIIMEILHIIDIILNKKHNNIINITLLLYSTSI